MATTIPQRQSARAARSADAAASACAAATRICASLKTVMRASGGSSALACEGELCAGPSHTGCNSGEIPSTLRRQDCRTNLSRDSESDGLFGATALPTHAAPNR